MVYSRKDWEERFRTGCWLEKGPCGVRTAAVHPVKQGLARRSSSMRPWLVSSWCGEGTVRSTALRGLQAAWLATAGPGEVLSRAWIQNLFRIRLPFRWISLQSQYFVLVLNSLHFCNYGRMTFFGSYQLCCMEELANVSIRSSNIEIWMKGNLYVVYEIFVSSWLE